LKEGIKPNKTVDDIIRLDVKRSLAHAKYVPENSFLNILRAYALYNKSVGYCQGMSFIVELIISMTKDEALTFSILAGVIERLSLKDIYGERMDLLHKEFYRLRKLLEIHLPNLQEYLRIMGLPPGLYSTSWMITLFTSTVEDGIDGKILNPFLLTAWDHFIALRWKGIYKVIVFLMEKLEKRLIELNTTEILQLLINIGKQKFWAEEELAVEFAEKAKTLKITNTMLQVLSHQFDKLSN